MRGKGGEKEREIKGKEKKRKEEIRVRKASRRRRRRRFTLRAFLPHSSCARRREKVNSDVEKQIRSLESRPRRLLPSWRRGEKRRGEEASRRAEEERSR